MKTCLICLLLLPILLAAQTLTGEWNFDNPANLTDASIGNDLILIGSATATAGPETGNGAINIGVGSYYKCTHGVSANGGGSMVNEFTLVYDFKVASLSQWHCFFQTNYSNFNDGDCFINTGGQIGVLDTGYTPYCVLPNEWYRLVVAVDLGSTYKYYLDGQLAQNGGVQTLDGRFSLYPSNPSEPLLLFADNDGEDGPISIAYCGVYNSCLTATQVSDLGGYGHNILPPSAAMLPYLQTPTPTSMYVCWHEVSSDQSLVQYGTTTALGSTASGSVYTFDATTKWHKVKLQNLQPDTEYFYRCVTGTQLSAMKAFRTPPAIGTRTGHYRFVIVSDSQDNPGQSSQVINKIIEKLTALYGTDWYNNVQLMCHGGDITTWGMFLSYYVSQHFGPFSPISGNLPIMIATGNHEFESSYFYNYMAHEDIAGPEGEPYYSFDIGTMRFIFLNPNITTTTESSWLQSKVTEADNDPNLDWIFTFDHMPAYSEVWPDGNDTWAQNTIWPILESSSKAALFASGHSHNYERGVTPTGEVTTLICGGCGGTLDRWGMYSNQQDYPNTLKAMDQYHWVLVDVNLENHSYHATMYSLGNPNYPRDNEIMDEWDYQNRPAAYIWPSAFAESATTGSPLQLTAGQTNQDPEAIGTHFQVAADLAFSSILVDAMQYNTDIYGDSGSPNWNPVDLNNNLDLWRYQVPNGILQIGNVYYWRVAARDPDFAWSGWTEPRQFVYQTQTPAAEFVTLYPQILTNYYERFFDTSIGNPTAWAWDFDGDGITDSFERDPVWHYANNGTFDVTLTAIIGGQEYTVVHQVIVFPDANGDETIPHLVGIRTYPNPFQDQMTISLELAKNQNVRADVYNLKGELVRQLVDARYDKGKTEIVWDGKADKVGQVANGIYLIRVVCDNSIRTTKSIRIAK